MPRGFGRRSGKRKVGVAKSIVLGIAISAFVLGTCFGFAIHHFAREGQRTGPPREWLEYVQKWRENFQGASIDIAAVRTDGEPSGVLCKLDVQVSPGEGHIYFAIDPLLVGFDFQDASRKAVAAACANTGYLPDADGVGIAGYDVYFLISTSGGEKIEVQAIDGPSAGVATSIATIAVLENKRVKEGYVITGTVEDEEGSIGPVGGIFYKAEAAKNAGASHFLVPLNQSVVTMYQRTVRQIGRLQWVTYEPVRVNLNRYAQEQGWNLEIREVSTIKEAAELMLV